MEPSWRSRVCIWEHLARHLELPEISHTVIFLPYCLSFFWALPTVLSCSRFFFCTFHLILSAVLVLLLPISSCLCRLFIPSFFLSVCHCFLLVSVSPSVPSPAFLFLPLHYSICLFLTPFVLVKPCSQTCRDFPGDCKQVSPTLCRHESMRMLQLWKCAGCKPSKARQSTSRDVLLLIHMVLCDAPLNPNTIKGGMRLI